MKCSNCEQDKPEEEFHRALNEPWGLDDYCDVCWKAKRTEAWTIYRRVRREGQISPANLCEDCYHPGEDSGKWKIEGHHLNYHYALFVVWVCTGCHRKRHIRYNEEVKLAREQNLPIPRYYPPTPQGHRRRKA